MVIWAALNSGSNTICALWKAAYLLRIGGTTKLTTGSSPVNPSTKLLPSKPWNSYLTTLPSYQTPTVFPVLESPEIILISSGIYLE